MTSIEAAIRALTVLEGWSLEITDGALAPLRCLIANQVRHSCRCTCVLSTASMADAA